jgi:hypothetical protein
MQWTDGDGAAERVLEAWGEGGVALIDGGLQNWRWRPCPARAAVRPSEEINPTPSLSTLFADPASA